jgi:hypothetical protein
VEISIELFSFWRSLATWPLSTRVPGASSSVTGATPKPFRHALVSQPSRLPPLVGRGRALEIILSVNDFDGETVERYGYVNRALPDTELDGFVDALARRIASFDRRPIVAAKKLVNQVSLPSADYLLDGLNSFLTALTWPEALQRIQTLLKQGLQQDPDFEKRWPKVLGGFLEDQPKRP